MNGLVLYKSKYGATRQYADWIGSDLKLPVIDPERMDDKLLTACAFLLIGASVYNGELLLKDWLNNNQQRLSDKRLFLFIVCAPSRDVGSHHQVIIDNIPRSIWTAADIVFLPGRLDNEDAVKKEHTAPLLKTVRSFASISS